MTTFSYTPYHRHYTGSDALLFLQGEMTDAKGRMIDDYLNFSADKWEECHDHIQWAFPSNISSAFNPNAPIVGDMVKFGQKVYNDTQALSNLTKLTFEYLRSIGFVGNTLAESDTKFVFDWDSPLGKNLITYNNHNYRRISRLLNCWAYVNQSVALILLGYFLEIYETTLHNHTIITQTTLLYWTKAATRNL